MSFSKLAKEIDKLRTVSRVALSKTPIILSDSKANYLSNEIQRGFELDIVWWSEAGASTRDQYNWLKDHLERDLRQFGSVVLYVWLGTCDLTVKDTDSPFIRLKSNDSSAARELINLFRDLYSFVRGFNSVNLVFLEIPPYSVYHWNKSHQRRHHILTQSDLAGFKRDDFTLCGQIETVNQFIRETNRILQKHSPRFALDLQNSRRDRYIDYSHHPYRTVSTSRYTYRFGALYRLNSPLSGFSSLLVATNLQVYSKRLCLD
ncbi:unnamed protein product [Mytilus coruscus]|uniref:Uncharacterized protein n=1 Tax=Mytilus coruscus TaxID=42192 RepID=A0A6J8DSZ1_MYTCO|nr:unnamed protein product [Mytilus coruscus]